jgi:hypothetical protein
LFGIWYLELGILVLLSLQSHEVDISASFY